MAYLEGTVAIADRASAGAADACHGCSAPPGNRMAGSRLKVLPVRHNDVQALPEFGTIEEASASLDFSRCNDEVVVALKPLADGIPERRLIRWLDITN